MEFSSALRDARSKAGFTQQTMADAMEIPKRSIENWETGFRIPPVYVQRLILNELHRIIDSKSDREVPKP